MNKCKDCKNYEPKKKKYKCSECGHKIFLATDAVYNVKFNDKITCIHCGFSTLLDLKYYDFVVKFQWRDADFIKFNE